MELAASPAAGLQRLIAAERPVLTVLGSAHDAPLGRVRLGDDDRARAARRGRARWPSSRAGSASGRSASVAVGLLPTPDSLRALRLAAALARGRGGDRCWC